MRNLKLLLTGFLLCSSFVLFAQQTVKGVIKDKTTGEGLPGVNVLVKGTTNGTNTDFDGNFEIKAKTGDILVFTYLGFKNQEITIGTNFNLTVLLEESSERLDEIVVVGYGTTTVRDATGSVEAITSKGFTKGNIVTPENLLAGRVSGVSITTSGAPGSGSAIRIRGGSSINASNDPLIIIDGLPINNGGVSGSRGVLATINPNDIESFSVLKDASATAIYGSRASNGVIIITTKKGKSSFSLDYDIQYSAGNLADKISVFSANEYRDIIAQQRPQDVGLLGNGNTDWQEAIFRNTLSSIHNLSVSGSILKKIPARLSIGFTDQEGALLTSNFKRNNVSLALNPSFFEDHLKVSVNFNRSFEHNRFADSGQIGAALRYDPTQPIYDSSSPFGGYYQHRIGTTILNGTQNPVAALMLNNNTSLGERIYGNVKLDYKVHFIDNLTATVNVGYDRTKSNGSNIASPFVATQNQDLLFVGGQSTYFAEKTNQLIDAYFNYSKEFKNVKTDFTAGYSYQIFKDDRGTFSGNILDPNSFGTQYNNTDIVTIGYFGRANITFMEKYLLTLNFRRDGSSNFSPTNRWANFAGAALAWKISDEDFLKDSKVFSNLKLRASYGENGQQAISDALIFLDKYRSGEQNSQYFFGNNVITTNIPSAVNPDLKWEETATLEFGLDYGLFDDKFSGSINAFKKNSKDLLFNAAVADGTNFTNSIIQNIGELEIRGLEFSLNGDLFDTEDFKWNFNFNATYLDREIKALALNQDVRTGGISAGVGATIQLLREGESPYAFHLYKQLYDANGNPIEGAYADLNGDGITNDDDRYLKESPDADVLLGFQNSFNYKNWDLAFNLRASIGNYVYNDALANRSQYELLRDNAVLGNVGTAVLNTNFQTQSDVVRSDIYLENASFLKMDNITLGYTFNQQNSKLKSVRLWTGVQNVFVITNYSGLDPEVFNGLDNLIYPRPRTFLFGANIKF